jgi:predicted amidohydrolase YtcJ
MSLVLDAMPQPDLEDDIQSLLFADALLSGKNITSATDAWIDNGMAEVYFEASTRGLLEVSYELNVRVSPDSTDEQFAYLVIIFEQANELRETSHGVSVAGIKIFLDGVVSSRTAALLGSYRDGSNGNLIWSSEALEKLLRRLAEVSPDLRPHFHAIGDAAVRQALDVIQTARASGYWTGSARPVIAHAELISDSDLPRFTELNVEVVVSPQWLEQTPERTSYKHLLTDSDFERLGDFTGLLAHDAHLSYGSDWPVSLPDPEQARKHAIDYVQLRSRSQTMNKSEILTKVDAIFTS